MPKKNTTPPAPQVIRLDQPPSQEVVPENVVGASGASQAVNIDNGLSNVQLPFGNGSRVQFQTATPQAIDNILNQFQFNSPATPAGSPAPQNIASIAGLSNLSTGVINFTNFVSNGLSTGTTRLDQTEDEPVPGTVTDENREIFAEEFPRNVNLNTSAINDPITGQEPLIRRGARDNRLRRRALLTARNVQGQFDSDLASLQELESRALQQPDLGPQLPGFLEGLGGLPGDECTIPCPNCTGAGGGESSILVKTAGRLFSSIGNFLQRTFTIRIPTELLSYLKERMPVSKAVALKECGTCKNERRVRDPSCDLNKYQAAASVAQAEARSIEENEAKLGLGGNRYTLIQGDELLEVGLGMNTAPSYRVDYCGDVRNWGVGDPENIDVQKSGLQVPKGAKCNHVQGLNPPASPGGSYIIKAANRCEIMTGSQGFGCTTKGPVTLEGGITRITGPEVTVGSQTGRTLVEGDTVNLNGKSIEVAPSDGHFFVKGTISNTGNMIVGGHAHFESASVVKLQVTGKNEPSSISSSSNIYGGPAFWGGPAVEGIIAALRELASYATMSIANPEQAKTVPSVRWTLGLVDEIENVAYTLRPIELLITGITMSLFGPGIVFNFPHVHALPDGVHVHETRIPDIDTTADSAKELRAMQAGVSSNAPLAKFQTTLMDVLKGVWESISSIFIAIAVPLQHRVYGKGVGGINA